MATLLEEVLALRARYDEEPGHSNQVAKLALEIFDGLKSWHRLEGRPRELLHAAALLHDIGWAMTPDGRGHHKWSARLIREQPWKHLSKDEVAMVAMIARYHRKTTPRPEHADFQELPASAKKLVMTLGGILRLADALDRTHTERVERVEAKASDEIITVLVKPRGVWNAERATFALKRDMLQLAAERPVECGPL
ncbi:MAG TPA: HD domain-containing protein [Candidatus Methylacidiphilales bacterium]|nr:HD domain-containing protein [Candidatus Methylacidiphilales bacterium]